MDWKVLLFGKRLASLGAKKAAPAPASKESPKAESKPAAKPAESKPAVAKTGSKKLFNIDIDYLAVVVLLVIVLFGAKVYGFEMNAPQSVIVTDKAVFTVDLVNDSDSAVGVVLDFYSPAKYSATYPKQIAPNSTAKATITVYNTLPTEQDVKATLEATIGKNKVQKEIILSFKPTGSAAIAGAFTALLSVGTFIEETANFSLLEWVAFIVLVIIAAVLLVAFVARLTRKNKGEGK